MDGTSALVNVTSAQVDGMGAGPLQDGVGAEKTGGQDRCRPLVDGIGVQVDEMGAGPLLDEMGAG